MTRVTYSTTTAGSSEMVMISGSMMRSRIFHNTFPTMPRTRSLSFGFNGRRTLADQQRLRDSVSELKSVYKTIKYEWPQCLEEDANPIELAILLLDDTLVGLAHRMPEFERLLGDTSDALRLVVNENHEIFNNSIGLYHLLLSTLQDSQEDALQIRQMLESSTRDIHDRLDVLDELDSTSVKYAEMIEVLEAMEELNGVPGKIDQLIVDKHIHEVYDVIAGAYKTAEKYNLWLLSAMNSVRVYLETQSNNLYDMIVDELQNEIYLKSVEEKQLSWHQLVHTANPKLTAFRTLVQLANLEQYIYNSANLDIFEIADTLSEDVVAFVRQLPHLHTKDASSDGSLHYIYLLLNTANKLNRLPQVLEVLITHNQQELHEMINRTTEECKNNNIPHLQRLSKYQVYDTSDTLGAGQFSDLAVVVLQDLFGLIFVKSLFVLQKHKAVADIVRQIESSQSISATSGSYDFQVVWSTVRKELQLLMINYIHQTGAVTESLLTDAFARKELFKFEDIPYNPSGPVSDVLRNLFPGYTSDTVNTTSPYIKNQNFNAVVEVLVPKNIYNMRVILEFFLIFTAGVQQILLDFGEPEGPKYDAGAFTFFNSFMKTSFLGKIDEMLEMLFRTLVEDKEGIANTLVEQSSKTFASGLKLNLVPFENSMIFQNALDFKQMFVDVCFTLNTSLTYRKDISDLILKYLKRFAGAYDNFYKELFSYGDTVGKPASLIQKWIGNSALTEMSGLLLQQAAMSETVDSLVTKEVQIMLFSDDKQAFFQVSKDDYLDSTTFSLVGHLLLTASWVLSWLPSMRKESNYTIHDNTNAVRLLTIDRLKHDWLFMENGRSGHNDKQNVHLALNSATIGEFDAAVRTFEKIRDRALLALRYDLRAKAVYYFSRSFKETDWLPKTEPGDGDQFIGQYNKEVFSVDTRLNSVLKPGEREGVVVGLPTFLNELMIRGSEVLYKVNSHGIKRIMLNIYTLQQMLRSVMQYPDLVDFTRASKYFEAFTLKEPMLVAEINKKDTPFSAHEWGNLARMLYSEKLADGTGSSFNKTKYAELVRHIEKRFA